MFVRAYKYSVSGAKSLISQRIKEKINPLVFEIVDESRYHQKGEETHFKVLIVSEKFEGLSKLKKHQLVYDSLGEVMGKFHALTLTCYTEAEAAT